MLKLVIENKMSFFDSSLKSETTTTLFLDDGFGIKGRTTSLINKENMFFEVSNLYKRVKHKLNSFLLENKLSFEDMIHCIVRANKSILDLNPNLEYKLYALLGEYVGKKKDESMFVEYVEIARGTICDFKQYLEEELNERSPLGRLHSIFYKMSQFTPCDNALDSLTQQISDIRKKSKTNEFEEIVNTLRGLCVEFENLKRKV